MYWWKKETGRRERVHRSWVRDVERAGAFAPFPSFLPSFYLYLELGVQRRPPVHLTLYLRVLAYVPPRPLRRETPRRGLVRWVCGSTFFFFFFFLFFFTKKAGEDYGYACSYLSPTAWKRPLRIERLRHITSLFSAFTSGNASLQFVILARSCKLRSLVCSLWSYNDG